MTKSEDCDTIKFRDEELRMKLFIFFILKGEVYEKKDF
jgi:hypothetical protein